MEIVIVKKNRHIGGYIFSDYISGVIAPIGQTDAHVPHEIHLDLSMTYLPSGPWEIAPTGHIPAHVPQPMHFVGLILYTILIFSCFINFDLVTVQQA